MPRIASAMYPATPLRMAFVNQQCRRSWTVGIGSKPQACTALRQALVNESSSGEIRFPFKESALGTYPSGGMKATFHRSCTPILPPATGSRRRSCAADLYVRCGGTGYLSQPLSQLRRVGFIGTQIKRFQDVARSSIYSPTSMLPMSPLVADIRPGLEGTLPCHNTFPIHMVIVL